MRTFHVGFIGFGQVASVFSETMRAQGADVSAYDLNLGRPGGPERLQARARAPGIRFRPLAETIRDSDLVLSTVRAATAVEAARASAPHLRAGQWFVDLNSTSPSVKVEIAGIIAASGASFAEGVILGAVGAAGSAAPILTGGEHGRTAAETLTQLGLRAAHFSPEIGKAAHFKLLRSIFSKGLEALLLEMLVAARRAGLERELWDDVRGFMSEHPFEKIAANWIVTHAGACARRRHEMEEVVAALRESGLDPLLTAATAAFFRRSESLGLRPGDMWEVVNLLESRV